MTRLLTHAVPAALATASALALVGRADAQPVPKERPLGAVTASIAEPFGAVQTIRHLPDGRLLVNDPSKRRVILFDSSLSKYTVVADSTSATATAYSGRNAGLIPYRGDSTLFVDPTSMSMLVIDPTGKLGTRVMSVPRPDDAFALTGVAFGVAGFDAKGRLVYRTPPTFNVPRGPARRGRPRRQTPRCPTRRRSSASTSRRARSTRRRS